ncbi:MAG: PaaI family thioesterase [Bacteroidales bacterium]|nr:PaaI family thioesterase [Bacteroidales bacterium]
MSLLQQLNIRDRFARENGIQLTEAENGTATATLTVEERHLNGGDVCQGGAIFTLADLVIAAIVNQRENMTLGISACVYFHSSAQKGDTLTATGRMLNDHPKIPAVEVIVTNQDGKHIATATGQAYTRRAPNPF